MEKNYVFKNFNSNILVCKYKVFYILLFNVRVMYYFYRPIITKGNKIYIAVLFWIP
jgi:hypothetical protein